MELVQDTNAFFYFANYEKASQFAMSTFWLPPMISPLFPPNPVSSRINLEEPIRVASTTRTNLEEPVRVASTTGINLEEPIRVASTTRIDSFLCLSVCL